MALIVLGSIGNSDKGLVLVLVDVLLVVSPMGHHERDFGCRPNGDSTPAHPENNFTPGQENAIAKAQSYLDYTGFSKKGLIEQLEFNQFSTADATFAVEHLEANGGVDWNEQAVKKARATWTTPPSPFKP